MSTLYINNKVPKANYTGFNDQSVPAQIRQPEVTPIHMPLFWIMAPKGNLDQAYIITNEQDLYQIFGNTVLDPKKPHFTHQSMLLKVCLDQGNACIVKRIASPKKLNVTDLTTEGNQKTYTIISLGTTTDTQWQNLGVVGTPEVGATFIHNGITGVGTGIIQDNSTVPTKATLVVTASVNTSAPVYALSRNARGEAELDELGNNVYQISATTTVVTELTAGDKYQISSVNGTSIQQWQSIGFVGTPKNGETFIYNGQTASGTGTVKAYVKVPGAVTVKYNLINVGSYTDDQLRSTIVVDGAVAYPILKFTADTEGSLGNAYGIKLWTAGINAYSPADQDVVDNQQALLFNGQILTTENISTGSVVSTINGETYFTFALKPEAYNYKLNEMLPIKNFKTLWADDGFANRTTPIFSPIGDVTTFDSNLITLLTILQTSENLANPNPIDSIYMLDLFTGIQRNGTPHYGFTVDQTGSILSSARTHYLSGGVDGDTSNIAYEKEVINQCLAKYQTENCNLLDWGKYPFSAIYDSGFSNITYPGYSVSPKKALLNWMSLRPNVHVTLGTHVVNDATLTVQEELSVLADLYHTAATYKESIVWSTNACRASIFCQSGILVDYLWDNKRVSTVFDILIRRAGYLGASDGKVRSNKAYNVDEAKVVTALKDISHTSLNLAADTAIWTGAGNATQTYDTRSAFWPTTQSIFKTPESVINNEIFMQICCDVTSMAEKAWKKLSGRTDLTESEFIDESNRVFSKIIDGKYGNNFICTPNTYFTAADTARGNTWTSDVTVEGNVAKTTAQVNIITKRIRNTTTA